MTRVHAFADDALGDLDAVGLARALAAREVGIPEVVEAAIARVEKVDPELNAVAHVDFDRARERAASPRGGFFAGVPTFVKDNCDLAGTPAQHGTDCFVARPATRDGDLARMLTATGLLPLGKTQLSEFGFSAAAEHPRLGAVRSPWDTSRTAGASSSGSAALVAAGAVPIAHANDGGGSIRIPASVNGLVGLKPTRGRLAMDRMFREMPLRIVADGVVTRSVRDAAAFHREAERVYRPRGMRPIGDVTGPGRERLRIGYLTASVGRDASPEVAALTEQTAEKLAALGHHVEEIELPVPDRFADDFLIYWSLLAAFLLRTGRRKLGPTFDAARADNLTKGLSRHLQRNAHRLPLATSRLGATKRWSRGFFRDHDVVLTPTLAHETPPVGHLDPTMRYEEIIERLLDWVAYTPLQNATGDPSISLPLARTDSGVPQGMMLSAGWGREDRLLGLAHELEEAYPWPLLNAVEPV